MYVNVALDFLWCSPPAGSFPIACPRLFGPAFHPDAGRAVGAHGRLGRGAAEAVCGRGLRHLDAWWSQGYEHVPTCKHGGKQQGLASNMFYVHMTTFGIFGDDGWSSLMNTCSDTYSLCLPARFYTEIYGISSSETTRGSDYRLSMDRCGLRCGRCGYALATFCSWCCPEGRRGGETGEDVLQRPDKARVGFVIWLQTAFGTLWVRLKIGLKQGITIWENDDKPW